MNRFLISLFFTLSCYIIRTCQVLVGIRNVLSNLTFSDKYKESYVDAYSHAFCAPIQTVLSEVGNFSGPQAVYV